MRSKGIEHLRGVAALGTASPNLTNRRETTPAKRWCQVASGYCGRRDEMLPRCSGIAFCLVDTRLIRCRRIANECAVDCISVARTFAAENEEALKKEYWQWVLIAIALAVGIYFLAHGCSKKASAEAATLSNAEAASLRRQLCQTRRARTRATRMLTRLTIL